jgi:hypothetical protein
VKNADESDVGACFPSRVAWIAAAGAVALSGCLTVAPAGFVRLGENGCYRAWCDCNTLNAPAMYFEKARRIPYAEERVRCYPPIDRRMPGPRLLLASEQGMAVSHPAAAPIVTSPESAMPLPRDPDEAGPAPDTTEAELLPPPPAP